MAYSNIAIGTAKLLGYDLHINFNTPYFAKSTADFWRRWHISLSNWLKDYIYIPLGGNRRGIFRKNINIMIVFFISGIWHGTGVTFMVWGLLHGIYHVIGDITKNIRARIKSLLLVKEESRTENLLRVVTVFSLVSFAWIFFRANDVWDALFIIKTIFSLDGFEGLYKNLPSIILEVISSRLLLAKVVLAIIILTISSFISNKVNYEKYINQTPQIIRYMLAAIVMFFVAFALVSTGSQPDNQFIYFKF